MKLRTKKRKAMETVASGLVASKLDRGVESRRQRGRPEACAVEHADNPLLHARIKRILVPLDFSDPSKRAMRFAREWGTLFGAEVCLLHIVEPSTVIGESGTVPFGTLQRNLVGRARAALRKLACEHFPDSIPVAVTVRNGKAFDQIAAAARDFRADVVIIATHADTGLKHALLGRTAECVARHAPCPVLILRRRPNA